MALAATEMKAEVTLLKEIGQAQKDKRRMPSHVDSKKVDLKRLPLWHEAINHRYEGWHPASKCGFQALLPLLTRILGTQWMMV